MKLCKECNLLLSPDQFNKCKKNKDGLYHICRACKKTHDTEYRLKNKDSINLKKKKYRENNKEKISASQKRSYCKNKEHYLDKAKQYYEDNKELCIEYSKDRYRNKRDEILLKEKSDRQENPAKYLYRNAKVRAKKQGVPFDIQVEDIYVPILCPILGIELRVNETKVHRGSPSLDKIVPELGYVKGNIQVISHLANTMKSSATIEELMLFAKWIQSEFTNTDSNAS